MAQATIESPRHTNRLVHETSPYLLQHAHNPVDWYPWGDEALALAHAEDKPILLSVGYSACHWCHVMERESFEDVAIADLMNRHFVNIKVDREERPDIDSIYMEAVQALTGHGGWPMTVFLTPDGVPFYGGTYYPPEDRHGLPGFPRLLTAIADAWANQRDSLLEQGQQVLGAISRADLLRPSRQSITPDLLDAAARTFARQFDPRHGGFGGAPKFPQAMSWEFMLRAAHRLDDASLRHMVETTLDHMRDGGIYDHLGGGFHRYTVDAGWLVPHFEKMLYDNALLASLYLHGYQALGHARYRQTAEETVDYVRRAMTSAEGGFYAAQDADSEGVEGKYYVWSHQEIRDLLGADADTFGRFYDVTPGGNWEGHTILNVTRPVSMAAREFGLDEAALEELLVRGRATLLAAREARVPPLRDEKIITAWNGMMLAAVAEAAAILDRADYRGLAIHNADFLLREARRNGRLLRVVPRGQSIILGFQDDYAFLIHGLLALYEATFDLHWLEEARNLADEMIRLFWDDRGGFFQTGRDQPDLVTRPMDVYDNAVPSGNAMGADVLLRLAHLLGDEDYSRRSLATLERFREILGRVPTAFGYLLCVIDRTLATPKEVALVGPLDSSHTRALLDVVHSRYLPNRLLAAAEPGDPRPAALIPLLQERDLLDGHPTAYVCENYACQLPTHDPAELARQLG